MGLGFAEKIQVDRTGGGNGLRINRDREEWKVLTDVVKSKSKPGLSPSKKIGKGSPIGGQSRRHIFQFGAYYSKWGREK